MKLYLQQKVFSLTDKFSVKDETGNDKYIVKGEMFSIGKKLHIYNLEDKEIALVSQRVFSFLPKLSVLVNNVQVAEISKSFTLFNPKYTINGLNWVIEGDIFLHDYEILINGVACVNIHKKWMSFGDCYEIEIVNKTDEIIVLAVVLAIDYVLESSTTHHSD